jgi:ABC-2 type transport system ATP-binding protein
MSSNSSDAVISVNDLAVSFRGCDALKGISLSVPSGTVCALLGENGAGKTTLIRCLTGFLHPTRGSCRVLGLDPQHRALDVRRRIGYVSDAPALYDWMTVGEIGWFAASFYAAGFVERYRESVSHFQVPEDRRIKHLSKGQRAKVALALALAHDPELLILDEPTSGLDPLVRREFLESMIGRVAMGRTVLLSSHQIAEVERVADHVAILHEGKVKISESMSRLREHVHEITVTMNDSLAAIPPIASPVVVLSDNAVGRQRQLIVSNYVDELVDFLRSCPSISQVSVRNASLEDLFAACVRGKGQLEYRMANENEPYRVLG